MEAQVIQYLRDNGIDCLYHITSRKNWAAIREKGICALSLLEEQGLTPPEFGSDSLDREIRRRKGLDHFVSLSFSISSPFLHCSQKAGFLKQCVVIKISLDVLSSPESFIYDTNPVDETAQKGNTLDYLKSIRLDIAHNGTTARLEKHTDRRFVSAEVNIKGRIPVEFFLNKEELDRATFDDNPLPYQLFLFVVDQSDTMQIPIVYQGVHYNICADLSIRMVNAGISLLVNTGKLCSNLEENALKREIGTIGYGNTDIVWKGFDSYEDIKTVDDLLSNYEGCTDCDKEDFAWLEVKRTKDTVLSFENVLKRIKQVVAQWVFKHPNSRVFVIHITNGRSVKKNPRGIEKAAADLTAIPSLELINLQISGHSDDVLSFVRQSNLDDLDAYGSFLYRISSAVQVNVGATGERAFFVNSDVIAIVKTIFDHVS